MKIRVFTALLSGLFSLSLIAQNWSHVGPISTNQQPNSFGENKFETGQVNFVTVNPNNSNHIFTGGRSAGLWESIDGGQNWSYIPSSLLGVGGVASVTFVDESNIFVTSLVSSGVYKTDLSNKVGTYNFINSTWSISNSLPLTYPYQINDGEVINIDGVIHYYIATSQGVYVASSISGSWSQIHSSTAHSIKHVINGSAKYLVFSGGQNVNTTNSRTTNSTLNVSSNLMQSGLTWSSITSADPNWNFPSNMISGTLNQFYSLSKIDVDIENNQILIYSVSDFYSGFQVPAPTANNPNATEGRQSERLVVKKTTFTLNNSSFSQEDLTTTTGSYQNDIFSGGRIGIGYDKVQDVLWYGGIRLHSHCFGCTNNKHKEYGDNFRTANGKIHNDIHGIAFITRPSGQRILIVASDGGLGSSSLGNSIVTTTNNNINTYFDPINNGLNVMIVNGFSGATNNPTHYAVGGFDIINTDFFNESQGRNVRTKTTWENDGTHIDYFNNNLTIIDQSSFNSIYHVESVNYETGEFTVLRSSSTHFMAPIEPENDPPTNPTITANMNGLNLNGPGEVRVFELRLWKQDPYRPDRIYFLSHNKGLFQFDYTNNVFVWKLNLPNMNPWLQWGGWSNGWRAIKGVSLSPDTPNSMYLITGGSDEDSVKFPMVIKFVGENLDLTYGNYGTRMRNNVYNWQLISENLWPQFNSLFGCTLSEEELIATEMLDVETSVINKDIVYVLLRNENCTNVKILKYENETWSNYGNGLPSQDFVYTMIMDRMTNDCIYVNTSSGIYYRTREMSTFLPYIGPQENQMPIIRVSQMEINYRENTLRIGTAGQGIWKTSLVCPTNPTLVFNSQVPQSYHEAGSIVINSNTSIATSHPTIFRATNSIEFNPGFNSSSSNQVGRHTHAFIHGCDNPGSSRNFGSDIEPNNSRHEIEVSPFQSESPFIYPNPNNGEFNIELNHAEDLYIEIYDLSGKKYFANAYTDRKTSFQNVSVNLASGVYIIVLNTGEQLHQLKFIVK